MVLHTYPAKNGTDMEKHGTPFISFSLKHIWIILALAFWSALVLFGGGLGFRWELIVVSVNHSLVFFMVFSVSLTMVSLVDVSTELLGRNRWVNHQPLRRGLMQVAVGVVGVGLLSYGIGWVMLRWVLDGVLRFVPDTAFGMVLLMQILLVNLVVMFVHGAVRLKFTGATPKDSYLTHLLTLEGSVPVADIRFCYHHRHKMNRLCLRSPVRRSDPVVEYTLDELEGKLNSDEFMRVAPDLIIHQTAITDDGIRLPNRNRRVRLVVPYTRMRPDGMEVEIQEISISRRRVSQFEQWRKTYRSRT